MPRTAAESATIIQFPKVSPRPLWFSREERQALLALTYAVPGAEVDFDAVDCGDEYASLGAIGFEEGAWWTVFVTVDGFDVFNLTGCRVARFAAISPLIDRMKLHLAHMLDLMAEAKTHRQPASEPPPPFMPPHALHSSFGATPAPRKAIKAKAPAQPPP